MQTQPREVFAEVLAEITVELDRPRVLRLTLGALARYEEKRGVSLIPSQRPAGEDSLRTVNDMVQLMHALAVEADPTVPFEVVRDCVTLEACRAMGEMIRGCADAIDVAKRRQPAKPPRLFPFLAFL